MFNKKKKQEIETKSPLGGRMDKVSTTNPITGAPITVDASDSNRDYSSEAVKATLKEHGLSATETVTIKNPVTQKTAVITIERDGTPDSKLARALADPNLTRDQKDHVTSMYLWERGKESSSFILDLIRSKGAAMKDVKAFQSQTRFDFEMFVTLFTQHLEKVAKDLFKELGIVEYVEFLEGYVAYLKKVKEEGTMRDYASTRGIRWGITEASLAVLAVRNIEEADRLRDATKKVMESRMRAKGYGTYLSRDGKAYSIFDDHDIDEVVRRDQERLSELNNDDK